MLIKLAAFGQNDRLFSCIYQMQIARNEPSRSGAEFKVPDARESKIYAR